MSDAYHPPEIKLSPEHHKLMVNTVRQTQDLADAVKKVAACGIDCTAYEALRNHLRETAEKILESFGTPPQIPS